MKLVEIDWVDSCHTSGWTRRANLTFADSGEMLHRTIGYVVHECERSIAVCQSFRVSTGLDGSIDAVMEIPRAAIQDVRVIRKAPKH